MTRRGKKRKIPLKRSRRRSGKAARPDVPVRRRRKFVRSGNFKVYILECADGSFYTGHTNDIDSRLKLHQSGKGARYVRSRLPCRLVYARPYRYFKTAFAEERRIKDLTRREKEVLVRAYARRQAKSSA